MLAWGVIGWCQFALFNALHEGLHNRFGNPHREVLAYALAAYPVGFDGNYRRVHLDHHKYFGDPGRDPDYPNYAGFPTSKRQFLWRLLLNLCGWYALLQFLGIRQGTADASKDSSNPAATETVLWKLMLAQALVLLLFAMTVGWFYYVWLWLIPLVTFGKFYASTRTFCEHGHPGNQPTIRTITGSFAGEKILGVFCFNYHAEHHRFTAIPCNRLAAASAALSDSVYAPVESGEPCYEHYKNGYLQLLVGWFRGLPF